MGLSTTIRQEIDALIAADTPRQTPRTDGIISSIHLAADGIEMHNVSSEESNRIRDLLNGLSNQDLTTVMALTMYGAESASPAGQVAFQEMLADAREHVNDADGRNRTIAYLSAKPLSKCLPAGLKRAEID